MQPRVAERLATVPDEPGAYLMRGEEGDVIYVGKARSLRKRLQQWFRESSDLSPWAARMIGSVRDFDFIATRSELEAFALEFNLIKEHQPHFNLRLADDKSYPYLYLTDEIYPRLTVVRDLPRDANVRLPGRFQQSRGLHDPKRHETLSLRHGQIFGPYPSARSMRRTMRVVQQLFGLRSCRRHLTGERSGRPCLNYHIQRCVGPCTGEVTPEEYAGSVRDVALFLEGKTEQVIERLRAQMTRASERQDFERAAQIRDRLRAVETVTESQLMVATEEREQDALGVALGEGRAVVVLLAVRSGRLIEKQQFNLDDTEGHSEGEALEAFLSHHYAKGHVPREVLLSHEAEDIEAWRIVLSEMRGQKVRVTVPKRGDKRRLVELAAHNAELALAVGEPGQGAPASELGALEELAEALGLDERPERIECFDISNTQGKEATGAMVVFADGLPDKSAYRRFRMRDTEGKPDDYAMMAEMLQRRLRRAAEGDEKFLPLPDVMVVDGGKGQLSVVSRALAAWEIDDVAAVSLAKQEEEVFVPGAPEPIDMAQHRQAQMLLQRLRDEAHRFAISHHRGVRGKRMSQSALDDAPGVGPARKRALLTAFNTLDEIADASVEELAAVPGMDRTAAEALREFLAERRADQPQG